MKSKGRFRLLMLAAVALLLCSAAAITFVTRSSTPARAASVPTGLHVVGNQIEDGNGNVIVPHGVDRMGTEYQCTKTVSQLGGTATDFDGPVDQTAVSAMLSWDINIVRVPLNEDCWLGINGFPANGFTAAQYQSDIVNWVNLLNANGLIVILDLHWNNSGSNQSTGQEPMPDLDHAPAFWTSVANTFKNNSSVIFDLYNEPYTSSWSCWLNGSTAPSASPCGDVGFAVAGMQTLVNTVRATGATNILMLGGLAWSNDLTGWLANKPNDPDNNLVASSHIYNFNACANTSCWNSEIAPVKAQVPVLVGEMGENDCSSSFISGLMSWLDSENIGYLAWTWTVANCSSTPALISDYSGTPTNFGAGYKAHLIALAGSTPTPTPTPTHTPTPTPTVGVTPTPTPTHTPTPTPTVGVTPTPTPAPTNTPTPTPTTSSGGSSCKIDYAINSQWPGGFGATFTVTNTGTTTINGWTIQFTFANGQTITQLWNGSYTQSGGNVSITNLSYNGTIAPGATLSSEPGFNGSWNGTNAVPTSFTLNGVKCSS
jgi:cell division septation protein DedD